MTTVVDGKRAAAPGPPSAGSGAVMRPAVAREYAEAAGPGSVRELPVEDPRFRLHRLDA